MCGGNRTKWGPIKARGFRGQEQWGSELKLHCPRKWPRVSFWMTHVWVTQCSPCGPGLRSPDGAPPLLGGSSGARFRVRCIELLHRGEVASAFPGFSAPGSRQADTLFILSSWGWIITAHMVTKICSPFQCSLSCWNYGRILQTGARATAFSCRSVRALKFSS